MPSCPDISLWLKIDYMQFPQQSAHVLTESNATQVRLIASEHKAHTLSDLVAPAAPKASRAIQGFVSHTYNLRLP